MFLPNINTVLKSVTAGDEGYITPEGDTIIFRNVRGKVVPIKVDATQYVDWLAKQGVQVDPSSQKAMQQAEEILQNLQRVGEMGGPAAQQKYEQEVLRQLNAYGAGARNPAYNQAVEQRAQAKGMSRQELEDHYKEQWENYRKENPDYKPGKSSDIDEQWDSFISNYSNDMLSRATNKNVGSREWGVATAVDIGMRILQEKAKKGLLPQQVDMSSLLAEEIKNRQGMAKHMSSYLDGITDSVQRDIAHISVLDGLEALLDNVSKDTEFGQEYHDEMEKVYNKMYNEYLSKDSGKRFSANRGFVPKADLETVPDELPDAIERPEVVALMNFYEKSGGSKLSNSHKVLVHALSRLMDKIPDDKKMQIAVELNDESEGLHAIHKAAFMRSFEDNKNKPRIDVDATVENALAHVLRAKDAGSTQLAMEYIARAIGEIDGYYAVRNNPKAKMSERAKLWEGSAGAAGRKSVKGEGPNLQNYITNVADRAGSLISNKALGIIHTPKGKAAPSPAKSTKAAKNKVSAAASTETPSPTESGKTEIPTNSDDTVVTEDKDYGIKGTLGQMGSAISENLHSMLFNKLKSGELTENGKRSGVLTFASYMENEVGFNISSPEELKKVTNFYISTVKPILQSKNTNENWKEDLNDAIQEFTEQEQYKKDKEIADKRFYLSDLGKPVRGAWFRSKARPDSMVTEEGYSIHTSDETGELVFGTPDGQEIPLDYSPEVTDTKEQKQDKLFAAADKLLPGSSDMREQESEVEEPEVPESPKPQENNPEEESEQEIIGATEPIEEPAAISTSLKLSEEAMGVYSDVVKILKDLGYTLKNTTKSIESAVKGSSKIHFKSENGNLVASVGKTKYPVTSADSLRRLISSTTEKSENTSDGGDVYEDTRTALENLANQHGIDFKLTPTGRAVAKNGDEEVVLSKNKDGKVLLFYKNGKEKPEEIAPDKLEEAMSSIAARKALSENSETVVETPENVEETAPQEEVNTPEEAEAPAEETPEPEDAPQEQQSPTPSEKPKSDYDIYKESREKLEDLAKDNNYTVDSNSNGETIVKNGDKQVIIGEDKNGKTTVYSREGRGSRTQITMEQAEGFLRGEEPQASEPSTTQQEDSEPSGEQAEATEDAAPPSLDSLEDFDPHKKMRGGKKQKFKSSEPRPKIARQDTSAAVEKAKEKLAQKKAENEARAAAKIKLENDKNPDEESASSDNTQDATPKAPAKNHRSFLPQDHKDAISYIEGNYSSKSPEDMAEDLVNKGMFSDKDSAEYYIHAIVSNNTQGKKFRNQAEL